MIRCANHNGLVNENEIVWVFDVDIYRRVCRSCLDLPPDDVDEQEYCEFILPESMENVQLALGFVQ